MHALPGGFALSPHTAGQESQMYFLTSLTNVVASFSSLSLQLAVERFSMLEQTKTIGKGAFGWAMPSETLHCNVDP